MKSVKKVSLMYVICPLAVCVVMLVVATYTGCWPLGENPYRSYTLQACAWLNGRLDVGGQYTWLELAVVGDQYYVSFPPFPSFVLLPFAIFFGQDTPDHLISMTCTVIGIIYALKVFERVSGSMLHAGGYVLFLYLGNGYLFISMQGWVWFLAQCMCFTLSLMAIYYAVSGKGGISMTCWACAVGCRPMVVVYYPLLCACLYKSWKSIDHGMLPKVFVRRLMICLLPAIGIGIVYMSLNIARFGNPFEFGHKYLPEFINAENGQFSFEYLEEHLKQLLRLPRTGGKDGALIYDTFDCMAFWLIAPMTLVFVALWFFTVFFRKNKFRFEVISLPLMIAIHVVIICCHKTLGGYQFGNRYIVDILPYIYYGIITWKPERNCISQLNIPLFMLGFSVNLIGTVATYNHWM